MRERQSHLFQGQLEGFEQSRHVKVSISSPVDTWLSRWQVENFICPLQGELYDLVIL